MTMQVGLLLFPNVTQLDMTGPYEVFTKFPDTTVHVIWKDTAPVTVGGGLQMIPSTTMAECPALDVICVPGGGGMNPLLNDEETLAFIAHQAKTARYVTAVCTGSLVLGAAGLLKGRRATTHWMSHDMLIAFGATPVNERVVVDGNLITGGGVTAGIDFALVLAAQLFGAEVAQKIQLGIEYDPQPPFPAGSPRTATPELVAAARASGDSRQRERQAAVDEAATRLLGVAPEAHV
jgi:cyclohexyl-isocyanide hydratase